jgi:hemerythrin-like metal-binding protein
MSDGQNYPRAATIAESSDRDSTSAASWPLGDALPPALVTGHEALDFDHRQLLSCIKATRSICIDYRGFKDCSTCTQARHKQCDHDLVRLLGDLISFILDHFQNEESIMRDTMLLMVERDLCEAHMEDHAAISAKVQQIVTQLDAKQTVVLLRELDLTLDKWFRHHIFLHDTLLGRWAEREDSLISNAKRRTD